MKQRTNYHFLGVVIFLSFIVLPPSSPAQEALLEGRTRPGGGGAPSVPVDEADALVIREEKKLSLGADGIQSEETLVVKKILTYEGMDGEGDPHIAFNEKHQALEVLASRTTTPEGKILDTRPNGMNPITPFPLARAPFFTDGRQMVVTHVGLDIGAVTELRYTVRDKEPWRPFLSGEEPLASHNPMREKIVSVSVPEGTALHTQVLGCEAHATSEARDGVVKHTWEVAGVPLLHTEAATRAELSFLPRIVYSTASSWEEAAGPLFGKMEEAMVPDEALREKAAGIVSDGDSQWRKLGKLHAFVHARISPVDWPLESFPEAPRKARDVYRSRYGLAVERAALLGAFLDAIGVESELLFVSRGPVIAQDVPAMCQFPIPVLEVIAEGRSLWIDPGVELTGDVRRDYLGRSAIRFRDGKPVIFTIEAGSPSTANRMELRSRLALDEKRECKGDVTAVLAGVYSPHMEMLLAGETPEGFMESLLQSTLPGFSMDSCTVVELSPERSSMRARVSREPAPRDSLLVLTLGNPGCSLAAGQDRLYRQARDLPFLLAHPGTEILSLELELPEGTAGAIVMPLAGEEVCRTSKTYRKVSRENGMIEIERGLEVGGIQVSPDEYPALRSLMGFVSDRSSNSLSLAR